MAGPLGASGCLACLSVLWSAYFRVVSFLEYKIKELEKVEKNTEKARIPAIEVQTEFASFLWISLRKMANLFGQSIGRFLGDWAAKKLSQTKTMQSAAQAAVKGARKVKKTAASVCPSYTSICPILSDPIITERAKSSEMPCFTSVSI